MAIIGKIRGNSTLVVGVVFGTLALFILGDWLGGKGQGQGPDDTVAGEVFGTEISRMEYEKKVAEQVEQAKANNPDLTTEQEDNIREDVWNQMVNKIIFDKELSSFNFVITPAELNDLIFGNNIQEYVRSTPMFQNRMTQQFSVDSVKIWRQRIERSPEGKAWWVNNLETPVKDNRRIGKYFNMIKQGLYVTSAEIQQNHIANNRKYKIRFITKSFAEIPDSTIKVTDEEIKEYYEKNKNKKKYEAGGSRAYSWVEFDLKPSETDKEDARKRAEDHAKGLKSAKSDSTYVMLYAETKVFNDQWSQAGMFPADVDTLVQKADSGTIIGPFLSTDPSKPGVEFWKVVKVRDTKTEIEMSARHILLRGDEKVTKPRADSIIRVIRKNKNFAEMAAKFGTDGTKDKGGDLGWFAKGAMVPEFETAVFGGKMNDLQTVKTSFGIHILEVTGKREAKRVKAAIVDVKVTPGAETDKTARAKAVEFLSGMKDATEFQKVAQKMNLTVKKNEISRNQKAVDENPNNMYMGNGSKGGTNGGRLVAREIHRMNENDISANPVLFNDKYVVIKLDNIKEKGVPEFEDVKEIMKAQVLIAKKGEQEAKKMKGAKSLEELATRLKLPIKQGELSFSSNQFPEAMGYENEVIGSVFAMSKPGDMSIPLKGKSGVYVVVITGITEAQPLKDTEKTDMKKNLTNMLRQRAQNDAYSAIRELAKIEDNRSVY
ncbi:MAG TPA: peptidyl-prolyl cis-trans isomerase [Flavobacteriales bacterium]|nr:peptidyl-prolyl cis-trans isomerase [Flavobacteriales bacterium]